MPGQPTETPVLDLLAAYQPPRVQKWIDRAAT